MENANPYDEMREYLKAHPNPPQPSLTLAPAEFVEVDEAPAWFNVCNHPDTVYIVTNPAPGGYLVLVARDTTDETLWVMAFPTEEEANIAIKDLADVGKVTNGDLPTQLQMEDALDVAQRKGTDGVLLLQHARDKFQNGTRFWVK